MGQSRGDEGDGLIALAQGVYYDNDGVLSPRSHCLLIKNIRKKIKLFDE